MSYCFLGLCYGPFATHMAASRPGKASCTPNSHTRKQLSIGFLDCISLAHTSLVRLVVTKCCNRNIVQVMSYKTPFYPVILIIDPTESFSSLFHPEFFIFLPP